VNRLQLERAQVLIYVAAIAAGCAAGLVRPEWWIPHRLVTEESA